MSELLLPSILSLYEAPILILSDIRFSVLATYTASISLSFALVLFLKQNTCDIVSHLCCCPMRIYQVVLFEQECLHTLNRNVVNSFPIPSCNKRS